MDGLEAARAIRALGGDWARIPIAALTANAFADDVKACRAAGMDEFIAKPMRKKVLVEKLAVLLAGHPSWRCRQAGAPPPRAERRDRALPVTPAAEVAMADVAPVLDVEVLKCLAEEIVPTACARRSTCSSPTRRSAWRRCANCHARAIARGSRMRRTGSRAPPGPSALRSSPGWPGASNCPPPPFAIGRGLSGARRPPRRELRARAPSEAAAERSSPQGRDSAGQIRPNGTAAWRRSTSEKRCDGRGATPDAA